MVRQAYHERNVDCQVHHERNLESLQTELYFSHNKQKDTKNMRSRRLKNEINVVPYIDVMLVLLVIFMVTAPMMTPTSIDLPSVKGSTEAPANALRVNVHIDSLSLTFPDGKENKLSREALIENVREAQRQNPDQPVLISGDKSIKYDEILSIMGELRSANIQKIGLLVLPSQGSKK